MAAHFFDIDGTLVDWHTNEWLSGAKEYILQRFQAGDQIIIMTMRGWQDEGTIWSIENTKKTILKDLEDIGVKYTVIFSVASPRVFHDDNDIFMNKRQANTDWQLNY